MISDKYIAVILLTFFSTISCGCSSLYVQQTVSPYKAPDELILDSSGDNRAQLEHFLGAFDHDPEERQAAEFLVANLPPCDRAALSTDLLKENLEYAFLTRRTTPWGADVSWTDFLHYVLPHRVSQEQAVSWRSLFYNELIPVVSNCTSVTEAVLAVNRWCFSKTGFQSTQRWDQNPLMTINRGWGRCEEAVILTVCALRSVGIPARQAMVPAWQHSDDNHTWTEVMVDGKWHYIESANPDYGLDQAWFSGSTRKAPLVLSYAYGQISHTDSPVLNRPFGCTIINSTARYAPTSELEITVLDRYDAPVPDTRVFISVFNYASFRPVAAIRTDNKGKAKIDLGPGSVLLSAMQGNASDYAPSIWIPGEQNGRTAITLRLDSENGPEEEMSFRFAYKDPKALPAPRKNSEGAKKDGLEMIRKSRIEKLESMEKLVQEYSPPLPGTAAAGLNTPQILQAADNCPSQYREALLTCICGMATADLVKITADELLSNAATAVRAREKARKAGLHYKDKIFEDFVLNPRIMYEQLRPWRAELAQRFKFGKSKKLKDILKEIDLVIKTLTVTKRGPLGSSTGPLGVYRSGTASNKSEKGVFATAAMRAAGIPARYLDEQGWVEFYDGTDWQPFYPENPAESGNRNATNDSRAYYSVWRTVKFSLPGFGPGQKPARYFKDFTVSQRNREGCFTAVEKTITGQMDERDNTWVINIPEGDYYLFSAKRNKLNEPHISVIGLKEKNKQKPK